MAFPCAFVAAALFGLANGATLSLQEPKNCPPTAEFLGIDIPVPAWSNNCTLEAGNQTRVVTKELHLLFMTAFSGAIGNAYSIGDWVLQKALDQLEDSDILPGYRMKLHVGDARCSTQDTLSAVARGLTIGPTKHGVIGPACSAGSKTANDMIQYWNLLQVGPWSMSNELSDPARYPNFVRLTPSLATVITSAYMLTRYFGWERIGIVKGTQDRQMMGFAIQLLSGMMQQEKAMGSYDWTMLMNDDFTFPDLMSARPDLAVAAASAETMALLSKVRQRDSRITFILAYEHELVWFWCMSYHMGMKSPERTWIIPTGWYTWQFAMKWTSIPGFPCTSDMILETGYGALLFSMGGWAEAEFHELSNTTNQAIINEYFEYCLNVPNTSGRGGCDFGATAYMLDAIWHFAKIFHSYLVDEGNSVESITTPAGAARLFNLSLQSDYVGWSGRIRFYSPQMPGPAVNALFGGAYGDRDGDCMARQFRQPEATQPHNFILPKVASISSSGRPNFILPLVWSAADPVTYKVECTGLVCDFANGWKNVDRLESCARGAVWSVALGCTECDPGKFAALGDTECTSCSKGTFANVSGMPECRQCSKGSAAKQFNAVACEACDAGTFADVEGMSLCDLCPKGRFNDQIGVSECDTCPAKLPSTVAGGSRDVSECTCKEGFYQSSGTQECLPCMRGLDCPAGSKQAAIPTSIGDPVPQAAHPKPKAGFYTKYEEPLSVYQCMAEQTCPGGRPEACSEFNEELNCGFCKEGTYSTLEGLCSPCADIDGHHQIYVIVFSVLAPIVIMIVCSFQADEPLLKWHLPQNGIAAFATVAVAYVQIIGLNALMQLQLPESMKATTEDSVFAISPLKFVHPECSSVRDFGAILGIQLVAPIYFALICVAAATLSSIVHRFRPTFPSLWPNTASIYGNVYSALYIAVASATFQLFMCYDHPNGLQSLRSASYIICYESEWKSLLGAAAASILVFCIGALALFITLLYMMPKYFQNRNYRISIRFLIFKFRCGYGRWTIVLLIKGLWVALSTVVFTEGSKQILWLNAGIITYCLLTTTFFPFRHMAVNIIDIAAHAIIVFGYNVSMLWATPQQDVLDWLTTLNVVVVSTMYFIFVGAIGYQLWLVYRQKTQGEAFTNEAELLSDSVVDAFMNVKGQQKELSEVLMTLSIHEQGVFRRTRNIMMREWGACGPLLQGSTEPCLRAPDQKGNKGSNEGAAAPAPAEEQVAEG